MPRIRTIKPEFWQHEELASTSEHARLLAIALLNYCDDEGYFLANVALVRSACFPFEDDSTNVRRSLDELSNIGYVQVRRGGGKTIGRVVAFKEHQRIDRPQKSKLMDLFEQDIAENTGKTAIDDNSTNDRRMIDERSAPEREREREREQGTGKGNREQGNNSCSELAAPASKPAPSERSPVFNCAGSRKQWQATDEQIDGWIEAYPAVDVLAEMKRAKVWIDSNPVKKKTASGMARYINAWLSKSQNNPDSVSANGRYDPFATSQPIRKRVPSKQELGF